MLLTKDGGQMNDSYDSIQTDVEPVYVLAARSTGNRWEFLLVHDGSGRWTLPNVAVKVGQTPEVMVRESIRARGVNPVTRCYSMDEVLDGDAEEFTAYVVVVEAAAPFSAEANQRWCFPEEARMRIRRKPLRRLVDAALHHDKLAAPHTP